MYKRHYTGIVVIYNRNQIYFVCCERGEKRRGSGVSVSQSARQVVSIEASSVRFEGFEVIHGLTGVSIDGSQNTVKHNLVHDTFTGIQVGRGCCMLSSIETHHVVTRNHVYNNALSGIAVSSSENTIRRNRANKNGEGVIVDGSNNTLTNNQANKNFDDGFIISISGKHNKIINNVIGRIFKLIEK
jgi:parallel beta-helix repeat protein